MTTTPRKAEDWEMENFKKNLERVGPHVFSCGCFSPATCPGTIPPLNDESSMEWLLMRTSVEAEREGNWKLFPIRYIGCPLLPDEEILTTGKYYYLAEKKKMEET